MACLTRGDPAVRHPSFVAIVERRDDLLLERRVQRLGVGGVLRPRSAYSAAGSMSQPFSPVKPSAHQPSPMLRCGTPLADAFMPLVPLASSGLRGLFIQTSHPCTK